MRIDTLHIKNFKGFEDEEFHLDPHFTVFIGDNGAGKTTVLEAICHVISMFFYEMDISKSMINKFELINSKYARRQTIEGQPIPQLPTEILVKKGEVNGEQLSWYNRLKAIMILPVGGGSYEQSPNIAAKASAMMIEKRKTGKVTLPVLSYYSTKRYWQKEGEIPYMKQEEGIQMAYPGCLSEASNSLNFLSWYKTYEDEIKKFDQPLDKALLGALKEAIISMIPEGRWEDFSFSFKDDDLIGTYSDANGTKNKLGFSQLSDGYRNIIGMVADIAYRCINLNPHLRENAVKETPGIVLIDELDQHLHPNWQRRIVADLKRAFPKVQFVATTHSPFIVQSLKAEELVNLNAISQANPKDLSIDVISHVIMDVESNYGIENQHREEASEEYFSLLETASQSEKPKSFIPQLTTLENNISDPAVRAFLRMNRIAKNLI